MNGAAGQVPPALPNCPAASRLEETVRSAVPVFVIVTLCGALVVPTSWVPKSSGSGETLTWAWVPVPRSSKSSGELGASLVIDSVWLAGPVAPGAKA